MMKLSLKQTLMIREMGVISHFELMSIGVRLSPETIFHMSLIKALEIPAQYLVFQKMIK
ncbi:hypothetical protein D3C85_1846750 [compost metagenome]